MPDGERLLLDTHTFIWMASGDPRLSRRLRRRLEDPARERFFSMAGVWEMAIKKSLGRLELRMPLPDFVSSQLEALATRLLDIRLPHVVIVESLPFHHRDPFDRLLVAQALQERLTIVSRDQRFEAYGVRRIW